MTVSAARRVLIVDDDPAVQRVLRDALSTTYEIDVASSGEDGLIAFERFRPALVLLDVMLPQMSGLAVLRAIRSQHPEQAVIIMTAYADIKTAVQAIKLGAVDYIQKPIGAERVLHDVGRLLTPARPLAASVRGKLLGESVAIKRAWRLVERFGPTDMPILIQGETGTGKGVMAEAVHRLSKRADRQFVGIDCATIPEQLAESELFGYEDGAFTGAGKRKRGRVAFADRGTLFLDEIGTLSTSTQAKLLTLLEQQHFLPLGSRSLQPTHVDVRFISATNVPLQRAIVDGTFRSDLFYRLNGITIQLPPLRERDDDLELLARHFVADFGRQHGKVADVSDGALDVIRQYSWPGNVRELQRVLSAAVVLADGTVTPDDLPEYVRSAHPATPVKPVIAPAAGPDTPINLREIKEWAGREAQKRVIEELQKRSNVSRQDLARMLGVDPKTLRMRLKEMSTGR